MTTPDPDRVVIFDTTLRDGEQSPGISLNTQEKVEIAHQLARLGVDIIEAGFPITSPGDFDAVQAIAREVQGPVICGLARTSVQDIDAAWNAIKDSERPRIHTFIATSDIHIERKLQTTKDDVKGQARAAVAFTMPHEYKEMFEELYRLVPDLKNVTVSVHCHNDLGLAVANSFAGLQAGCRQVECAVNGIGERAGNTSLEELVMLLHTRESSVDLWTGINTK